MSDIPRNILLNPGPATTTDGVKYAQVVADICPREQEFGDMVSWIQEQLVGFAGSSHEHACVLIGGSGTAAVEMVISSVVPADAAVLVINNGAYGARMAKIARIYNIRVVEFLSPPDVEIDYVALEEEIRNAREDLATEGLFLSHMAVVHHETTSGLLNNTAILGELCRRQNVSLISDAMSSYGAMPIDMAGDGIDYLISSSNKNIQGMAGVGIVICNKDALERSADVSKRGLYLNLYDQYAYFLETKQFRFTPPVQTLYALRQAIIETQAESIGGRYKRYRASYQRLRSGMEELGFRALLPEALSSGFITTFHDPQNEHYSFERMHDYLYERGFTIYPGKISQANTFRIANIGAISSSDIEDFLHCLSEYLRADNISV